MINLKLLPLNEVRLLPPLLWQEKAYFVALRSNINDVNEGAPMNENSINENHKTHIPTSTIAPNVSLPELEIVEQVQPIKEGEYETLVNLSNRNSNNH